MEQFEGSLLKLLEDCKGLIGMDCSYVHEISELPAYQICQLAFENDSGFKEASSLAGFWGTFNAVLQDIIHKCCRFKNNNVTIDTKCALERASELRNAFLATSVHYTSTARLLGVNLSCKEIILHEGLSLTRLNKKEKDERHFDLRDLFSRTNEHILFLQPTEIRMSLNLPVNRSIDDAFFDTSNEAEVIAKSAFTNIMDAILLIKDGQAKLGPQIFKGGPIGGIHISGYNIRRIPNPNIKITKKDVPLIIKAYNIVSGKSQETDRVILGAIHRFLLGRKREDLIDQLIDYTISWESLLLTQNGSPSDKELSYRFAINGSSLISEIQKDNDKKKYFKKMRCIYNLRSIVVHGGDEKKISKKLKEGDFTSLKEVCSFLENNFKKAMWWLIEMRTNDRPYYKREGWEDLLWHKQ